MRFITERVGNRWLAIPLLTLKCPGFIFLFNREEIGQTNVLQGDFLFTYSSGNSICSYFHKRMSKKNKCTAASIKTYIEIKYVHVQFLAAFPGANLI